MNNKKICKNKDVILRNIHSTFFLINTRERYYEGSKSLVRINDIGRHIWESFDLTNSIEVVCDKIIEQYVIPEADIDSVKKDLKVYCDMLRRLDYISYVE